MTDAEREQAFLAAKATADTLWAALRAASAVMRKYDSLRGPMGLAPDAIRFSPAYRAEKAACDEAHARLAEFNKWFTKEFARELRAERNRRKAQ